MNIIDHFCACSVGALNFVSAQSPKECILQFIGHIKKPSYNSADHKYVDDIRFGYYIHVFFAGPHMPSLLGPGGIGIDHHYSSVGSCDALAAYIRECNLGTVVETPPRWNHRHADRKPGQGDVIGYIWTPDPEALEKWWLANKPK